MAASRLETFPALLTVVAGGMTSVMVIYFLGRRFGREFFMKRDYKLFSANDILAVEKRFQRYGGLLLVASRFVVGFRVALALAAGMGKYSVGRMLAFSSVSYFLFAGLLMFLGYKLVENYDRIAYYFRTYNYIGWPLVIGVVLVYVWRRVQKIRKARRS